MKNKYYTPSIEEFHVGFEYEAEEIVESGTSMYWEKYSFEKNDSLELLFKVNDWYSLPRVKYLDKKDIESLGFKEETIPNCFKEDSLNQGYLKDINEKESLLLHYSGETKKLFLSKQVVYNEATDNWYTDFLFQGSIKNKSEFKKLLRQLNIK